MLFARVLFLSLSKVIQSIKLGEVKDSFQDTDTEQGFKPRSVWLQTPNIFLCLILSAKLCGSRL